MNEYDQAHGVKRQLSGAPGSVGGQFKKQDHPEDQVSSLASSPTTVIASNAAAYLSGDSLASGWGLSYHAGDFVNDFDMDAVENDYVAQVTDALHRYRPDWTIAGDTLIGGYPAEPLTEDEADFLREEIADINADEILAQHERTVATAHFNEGSTTLTIDVPDAEDFDFALIGGESALTSVDFAPDKNDEPDWTDEEWEPERYRNALREAGWVISDPQFESGRASGSNDIRVAYAGR